ncbi:histidine kinase dimerization/phospho-acceptor domain-containing protein, partial [Citrobacter braakii]
AVVTIVICGLLSWFAAYKGLAPLRAMKSRATTLTSQRLHQRMPVEAVPIEMADLAHELNKMLDRLEDAFTRLSEFSSNLAHELRTPLSNLLTQTQVALATRRDADTYREILASNAEELQRLGRMVSD